MKRAIILVGGPGSGKDIILKEVLSIHNFKELKAEQLKETKFYTDNLVVTANAYDYDKVIGVKDLLEKNYYDIHLVYVDVIDEISKTRMLVRNLNEDIRHSRLVNSKKNYEKFLENFRNVYYFDNDYPIGNENTNIQLEQFNEYITDLFESLVVIFKKALKKKNLSINKYDPLPTKGDGLLDTFSIQASGNGDLMRNYESAIDPVAFEPGIGLGVMGNASKTEPMNIKSTPEAIPKKNVFKRVKKIVFAK